MLFLLSSILGLIGTLLTLIDRILAAKASNKHRIIVNMIAIFIALVGFGFGIHQYNKGAKAAEDLATLVKSRINDTTDPAISEMFRNWKEKSDEAGRVSLLGSIWLAAKLHDVERGTIQAIDAAKSAKLAAENASDKAGFAKESADEAKKSADDARELADTGR
jgi:hypothetical protein